MHAISKSLKPELSERACGGWLAVSSVRSSSKLGVTAESKEAALAAFRVAEREWEELKESKDRDIKVPSL